jgi:FkbM family methyltransferase
MTMQEARRAYAAGDLPKSDYVERMHAVHAQLFTYADLIAETDIERIEIDDQGVVVTFRSGARMALDRADQRIAPIEALNFGRYEPEETAMVAALVRDGDCVYDIGANHGWYAITLALTHPGCRIEAFEPIPATFRALARNVELNAAIDTVTLHQHGFSDEPGETTAFFYPEGSGNASLRDLSGGPGVEQVTVSMRRLDDLVAEGAPAPDFLKIDVEGAELLVLRGARRTLEMTHPPVFAELLRKWAERFGYQPNDVIALMGELGYRCFRISGTALVAVSAIDEATTETNFLFLHPQRSSADIAALELV